MASVVEQYLNDQSRKTYTTCKNLKRLSVGETVMVNWFPRGEVREAKVVRFEYGKPVVELKHDGALLAIESAAQVQWDERAHSKTK